MLQVNEDVAGTEEAERTDLHRKVVEFCMLLRNSDFGISSSETMDAANALTFIDLTDERAFYNGLKTALVKKPEQYQKFDLLFRLFWMGAIKPTSEVRATTRKAREIKKGRAEEDKALSKNSRVEPKKDRLQVLASMSEDAARKEKEVIASYSPIDRRGQKSFGKLDLEDRAIMKRGLRTFARRMATLPGRRSVISTSGGELDFRRTLRASLKSGGHMTNIRFVKPKISKSRLVFLCDVSGSMDTYSAKLLKLLYYACNTIRGVEVFAFSTELVSINRFMQGRSLAEATRLVSENVDIWSSGTRIGTALGLLLSEHPGVLRPSTVLVVVSDGWELGDLDILTARLAEIKRRVAKLVWLNPHADSPNYEPLAAGIKSALPFVDVFSGLDIFTNRNDLERVLGKSIHATQIRNR